MSTKLNENQLLAIPLVAQGVSGKNVAKKIQVTEETVSRWKKLPEFQAEVNALLKECRDETQHKLRSLVNTALEVIKDELLSNSQINTCTFGDITDIDLQKSTIFPLGHILIESVSNTNKTLEFSFTVLTMDQVDQSSKLDADLFTGNSNLQDILNTQLAVSNRLVSKLRNGTLYDQGYQLLGDPSSEPFFDRFENVLAGWSTSFTVQVINEIDSC